MYLQFYKHVFMSLVVNSLFLKFYEMWLNQETTVHSFILYWADWRVQKNIHAINMK